MKTTAHRYPIYRSKRISILLFALLSISFIFSPQAHAQSVRNMTIIPPSVEKTVNPGDKFEGTLKLVNDTDATLDFSVDIRDYIVQDTIGTPNILPPNTLSNRFSASAWVGVVPNQFSLDAHKKQELTYYIQVPKDAAPGGHYMAVIFTPKLGSTSGTGAVINQVVGTIFKIGVSGAINEYALITNLSAPTYQENGPVRVSAQIQNSGDLHIKPTGKIVVTDTFGRQIQEIPLPDYNIFPTAARDYQFILGSTWMVGRFQAKLIASYGVKNNLPLSAGVVFYVFPWKVAVIIILVIITLILLATLRRRDKKLPETHEGDDIKEPEAI